MWIDRGKRSEGGLQYTKKGRGKKNLKVKVGCAEAWLRNKGGR